MRRDSGFSLLEVLVAAIIVGLTVTVLMQVLGGSVRLELKGRDKVDATLAGREVFDRLLRMDPRSDDFPWQGETGGMAWEFTIRPVESMAMVSGLELPIPFEMRRDLYLYQLKATPARSSGSPLTFVQLMDVPLGYFSLGFKRERMGEPATEILKVADNAD